ncbi:hypothetical protein [Aestuariibius sp. HNIBRBA575]|uniref:hypothetical protein n=1 Tax=Aestuariibius sp. HNIBRBA575 TaxID=3233343 RepID=UPI0034A57707
MKKTLIAGVSALSIALSGITATPAMATTDEERIGQILFGLAAIAVIGSAIQNQNDRENRDNRNARDDRIDRNDRADWNDRFNRLNNDEHHHGQYDHGYDPDRNDRVRQQRQLSVPRSCVRTFTTQRGERRIAVRRCVERNVDNARHLPRQCRVEISTDIGMRRGYGVRCLRRNGVSISR